MPWGSLPSGTELNGYETDPAVEGAAAPSRASSPLLCRAIAACRSALQARWGREGAFFSWEG